MEQTGSSALCRALETLDRSQFYLLAIVGSLLLSWLALAEQRRQLRQGVSGPSVFLLRLGASALVIGALGFFFCLALTRLDQARQQNDPVECRSARLNAAASVFVLAAALIRLDDLLFVEGSGQTAAQEADDQPPV